MCEISYCSSHNTNKGKKGRSNSHRVLLPTISWQCIYDQLTYTLLDMKCCNLLSPCAYFSFFEFFFLPFLSFFCLYVFHFFSYYDAVAFFPKKIHDKIYNRDVYNISCIASSISIVRVCLKLYSFGISLFL